MSSLSKYSERTENTNNLHPRAVSPQPVTAALQHVDSSAFSCSLCK